MKRKTFVGEMGWAMFAALACVALLIASQVYLEIIGDKSANVWTWLILGILTAAVALVTVSCYRYVRRHNAKVDKELRRQRENWTRANGVVKSSATPRRSKRRVPTQCSMTPAMSCSVRSRMSV